VVLVVDDHPDTREMYVEFLAAMGLETLEATTCAEALARVAASRIDAVVLDRRLPDGDGSEVCEALRKDSRTRSLPIIVLSGKEKDGAIPADAYLLKPVVPEALFAELSRLLPRGA
jgi:CheY-like chemotaxis protein